MAKVCSVRVIFESEIVRDFLCLTSSTQFGTNEVILFSIRRSNCSRCFDSDTFQSNSSNSSSPANQKHQNQDDEANYSDNSDGQSRAFKKSEKRLVNGKNGETFSYSSSSSDNAHRNGRTCDQQGDKVAKPDVELRISLPDKSVQTLKINRHSTADEVYQMLVDKIELKPDLAKYFYLFEVIDNSFGKPN